MYSNYRRVRPFVAWKMSFHGVPFFQDILNSFQETQDLHAMLNASGELLNMVLFGVLRQDGGAEERPPQT